jgi:hypothetical protein
MSDRILIPTNIPGISAIAGPPEGFDPLKASAVELRRYGYPAQPDPRTAPRELDLWRLFISRAGRRVTPVLRARPRRKPHTTGVKAQTSGWSGYAVNTSEANLAQGDTFALIYGVWMVPSVGVPPGPQPPDPLSPSSNDWYSATWVGIDGYGNGIVLQAGTEQDVQIAGGAVTVNNGVATTVGGSISTNYYAWYEWFPSGEYEFQNIPIGPGQTVLVAVELTLPSEGTVFFANLSTQQNTSLPVAAPTSPPAQGWSAEWIMEAPGAGGFPSRLSDYTFMSMWWAYARSAQGTIVYPGSGNKITLTNALNLETSTSKLTSQTAYDASLVFGFNQSS